MTSPSNTELHKCTACGVDKPKSEYYAYKAKYKEDFKSECIDCAKRRTRKQYIERRERVLAVRKVYRTSKQGKEAAHRSYAASREREPEKWTAREKLRYAVSVGKVTKQPCQECGELKVEAHHYRGYEPEYWLDVQWFCRPHHRDTHKFSLRSRGLA